MTETEWLADDSPQPLLSFLRGKASDRKLRLFAVACCRQIWEKLPDAGCRKAVAAAERFADGGLTRQTLEKHYRKTFGPAVGGGQTRHAACAAGNTCWRDAIASAETVLIWIDDQGAFERAPRRQAQGRLVRDIFNPFHSVEVNPGWLTWRDGTVEKLARAIYDEQAFDRLPILADALEEAGCADDVLLEHCRSGGHHARGCWALDAVLGKR